MNDPAFELHEHTFVSGPRSKAGYRGGVWRDDKEFSHSHPGGGVPHKHPHTGPSSYGYRKPKVTKKPKGEQFPFVAISEEESSFDLVITDSAKLGGVTPIGNTPIEQISMAAADRIMLGLRLKCIVRDERKKRA